MLNGATQVAVGSRRSTFNPQEEERLAHSSSKEAVKREQGKMKENKAVKERK